jgi:hypothetical protein
MVLRMDQTAAYAVVETSVCEKLAVPVDKIRQSLYCTRHIDQTYAQLSGDVTAQLGSVIYNIEE